MYRKSSKKTAKPENVYYVKNDLAFELVSTGTREFHTFLETKDRQHLLRSKDCYEEALEVAKEEGGNDLAFLNRKFATVIIRDPAPEQRPENYLKAKDHLQIAAKLYKNFLDSSPESMETLLNTINIELQRTLTLLGNVALELRDGDLLEATSEELLVSLKDYPNSNFKAEALAYKYHVLLSKGALEEAEDIIKETIEENLQYGTDYRHLAKINLLRLPSVKPEERAAFFKKEVLDNFWKSFDEHKKQTFGACRDKALLKDFAMFFYIKTVQEMMNIKLERTWVNHAETIFEYMARQARQVPGNRSPLILRTICNLVETIKNEGKINFAFKLFSNEPPNIPVSEKQFNLLFSDFKKFENRVQVLEQQSSKKTTLNRPFFQTKVPALMEKTKEELIQPRVEDRKGDSIHASVLKI